jgi:single-stranded DNA-binding protein
MNLTILRGHLRRAPETRTLASGEQVVGYELAAGRSGERAEPVPVVWHDPPAAALALGAGDEVVVVGRVRQRFFRAGAGTQSRTEVVADAVVNARHAKRSRAAVDRALARAAQDYDAEPLSA